MHTQDLGLPPSLARFPNLAILQSVNLIVGFTIKTQFLVKKVHSGKIFKKTEFLRGCTANIRKVFTRYSLNRIVKSKITHTLVRCSSDSPQKTSSAVYLLSSGLCVFRTYRSPLTLTDPAEFYPNPRVESCRHHSSWQEFYHRVKTQLP